MISIDIIELVNELINEFENISCIGGEADMAE